MSKKVFFIPLFASFLFFVVYLLLAQTGSFLSLEPGYSINDVSRWCERISGGYFREPSNALSNNGNNNLNIIKGTVAFKIINKTNSKIIKIGSISSSINTGSVSSLYSIDENNNFAKERISKYLASKLYRKILLNTYTSEN